MTNKASVISFSRRSFLQGLAGAAGLAAWNIPVHAGTGAASRVAVLGVGLRGQVLAKTLFSLAAAGQPVCLAAVADTHPENRARFQDRPGVAVFDSWRDCVGHDGVDAVVVALPDALHFPAALAALAAGKPVFLETPMAMHPEQSAALVRVAAVSGCAVQMAVNAAADPAWTLARRLVREGRIGRVVWCRSMASANTRGHSGDWRTRRSQSQGVAAQGHYEQVAALTRTLGLNTPLRVESAGGYWDEGNETPDSLITALHYPDGLKVNVTTSGANPAGQLPLLRGESGVITVGSRGVWWAADSGREIWLPVDEEAGHPAESLLLQDWLEAVADPTHKVMCPPALGHRVQTAVQMSLDAYETGQPVMGAVRV